MDTKDILVTVITVTYNSSEYVRDAIESVLSQDYPNIEYIIGDDCSVDETWKIVQEYIDPKIKSYRNEKNIGEYPNRNKAINLSTGSYIMFIDGDDFIYSHGISYFVRMMISHPEVAFAVQKGYTNNVIYPVVLNSSQVIKNYYFGKSNLLSSSFASDFFKSECLKRIGGLSEKYRIGDDEIRLRLATKYSVLFVAGWISWPRETPNQASSKLNYGTSLSEQILIVNELINTGFIRDSLLRKSLIKICEKKLSRFVLRSILRGEFGKARKALNRTNYSFWGSAKNIFYKHDVMDVLDGFTPAKPLKIVPTFAKKIEAHRV